MTSSFQMATIGVRVDLEKDLTIFTVQGSLSVAEILEYSARFYENEPTKSVLWDATSGTVSGISKTEFRSIAKAMKTVTGKRSGGKTALVGSFEVDYGLGRMYEVYADIEELPVEYRVFRTVEEALKWLGC